MKRKILISLFLIPLMLAISLANFASVTVFGSEVHDVAALGLTVSSIRLSTDKIVANATFGNEGTVSETFGVTLWADEYAIQTLTLADLAPGANISVRLEGYIWAFRYDIWPGPWTATQLLVKNLTMSVWAWPVAGEADTSDNFYTDGTVRCVWMFVDYDGNGKIEIKDLSLAAKAYGSYLGDPRWNPDYDINLDNKIDMKDLASTARAFGYSYA